MAEKRFWEKEWTLERLGGRSLDNIFPPLKSYLHPRAEILDVGCGPGTITFGVAAQVYPGSVVGIDAARPAIERAIALAEESQVTNVTFQVGDAYSLEFSEGAFDLTYIHNLLAWLREPLRALEEQRRVTKRGGWVIAGSGNFATQVIYPPCPAFERALAAMIHLNDPSDEEIFMCVNRNHELAGLFSQAGFEEIQIEGYVPPRTCVYPGSEYFDDRYETIKGLLDLDGRAASFWRKLIELGCLDEETALSAQREIEEWHTHPHAFNLSWDVLAAGRVA